MHRLVDAAVAVAAACRCRSPAPGRGAGCRSRCRTAGCRASQHALQQRDRLVGGGRVARAVGEEHPVRRRPRARRRAVAVGRQHVRLDAALGHPARGHRLDAEVERGDGEPLLADGRRRRTARVGGDLAGEVGAGHLGDCADPRRAARRRRSRSMEMPTRIAPRSRRCRVSARVSMPLMPTTPWSAQLVVERAAATASSTATGPGRGRRSRRPRSGSDSGSSSLTPVLPMCGAVITTTWRWYDGSVSVSW